VRMASRGGSTSSDRRRRFRRSGALIVTCLFVLAIASCGDEPLPRSSLETTSLDAVDGQEGSSTQASSAVADVEPDILIDDDQAGIPFDRRLLGTNVPAWIGPQRLADAAFQAATKDSGTSLLRMPGGSWSNSYDWLACELSDADGCYFTESARPTDFIDFMQATDLPGMWTVSINESAQSAAAAVSFFNGRVDNESTIGVDRYGVDWGTVGSWARLRAAGGNTDPYPIALWEVGNEVYGGRPESGGEECANFGWEDVWTCDGSEYIAGDFENDGYLAIRAAMIDVDPSIAVGAVGVGYLDEWSDWGNEVIVGAGDNLDFYVVHAYGFDSSPSPDSAVQRPAELWPGLIADVRSGLATNIPIAVTEYNLVSFEAGDTEKNMTRSMNALYIADTIGQLALGGVSIANQWNLANGTTESGTDYGMISLEDGSRFPQFYALAMWGRAGETLLPVVADDGNLRVYPTRHADGRLTVLMLNLSGDEIAKTVGLSERISEPNAELVSVWAEDSSAMTMQTDTAEIQGLDATLTVVLPPWSINALEIAAP